MTGPSQTDENAATLRQLVMYFLKLGTIGALVGAAFVLARGAIRDIPTAVIAATSLTLLIRYKIPEPVLVGVAGVIGLFLFKG